MKPNCLFLLSLGEATVRKLPPGFPFLLRCEQIKDKGLKTCGQSIIPFLM